METNYHHSKKCLCVACAAKRVEKPWEFELGKVFVPGHYQPLNTKITQLRDYGDVAVRWRLPFFLAMALKYLLRMGRGRKSEKQDLMQALEMIGRRLEEIELEKDNG